MIVWLLSAIQIRTLCVRSSCSLVYKNNIRNAMFIHIKVVFGDLQNVYVSAGIFLYSYDKKLSKKVKSLRPM